MKKATDDIAQVKKFQLFDKNLRGYSVVQIRWWSLPSYLLSDNSQNKIQQFKKKCEWFYYKHAAWGRTDEDAFW